MKYLFLIWKNIKRNKRRTLLTVLSIAVALFLFVSIRAVVETMDEAVKHASETPVLVVEDRYIPLSNDLPEAYRSTLESIAGVEAVLPMNFVAGINLAQTSNITEKVRQSLLVGLK